MKTYNEWVKLKESFMHPNNVPMDVAMAVYQIMHNQATNEEWELLDSKIATEGLNKVLEYIENILIANGMKDEEVARERRWFYGELTGHKNSPSNYN